MKPIKNSVKQIIGELIGVQVDLINVESQQKETLSILEKIEVNSRNVLCRCDRWKL
jgi:2C-methyl-D-erythritol 2,4-cyclodiphosphate synthase